MCVWGVYEALFLPPSTCTWPTFSYITVTLKSNMAKRTDQNEWMNPTTFIWPIYSHPSLSVWSIREWGRLVNLLVVCFLGSTRESQACNTGRDLTWGESTVKEHLTSIRVTVRHRTRQCLSQTWNVHMCKKRNSHIASIGYFIFIIHYSISKINKRVIKIFFGVNWSFIFIHIAADFTLYIVSVVCFLYRTTFLF